MAPTKFQIYIDQSIRQPEPTGENAVPQPAKQPFIDAPKNVSTNASDQPARYKPEILPPNCRFYFDERKIYPVTGGEYSFEEINFAAWIKRQRQLAERIRMEELERENQELREMNHQLNMLLNQRGQPNQQQQSMPSPTTTTTNRLSIVPRSLQPTQGLECGDVTLSGLPVIPDIRRSTFSHDTITLPIDRSEYIKENAQTSTPTSKRAIEDKRSTLNNRRMSRPSVGGSPTLKLSPITETSRDCNSKSSSSSSATSVTPSTTKNGRPLTIEPIIFEEPDRPLDPNDPSTYRRLLKGLPEPLDRRSGFFKYNRDVPIVKDGAFFEAGADRFLVGKELSNEAKLFTAQLLIDDSNDSTMDIIKTVCIRVDQPANEWLYYICDELHRRLVKQKTKPDIELSIMIAKPAVMYNDGSILVDEYLRFVSLQNFLDACSEMNKPFPRSVAAYITMEMIQLVRQMHCCDILHMNINPSNLLITCCPTRDDIASVDERTSIVKMIGFDRAMDTRLLPPGFKFDLRLDDLVTCEMLDEQPWSHGIDWFGTLSCIYKMFFLEDMIVNKNQGRWAVEKQFKGSPTNIWPALFDGLLNISDMNDTLSIIDRAAIELNAWIKANINFVLKEAVYLERILDDYNLAKNRSLRS